MNPTPRPSFSLQMTPSPGPAAVDPVCGMSVDPATAPAQVVHEGRTYYFCNPSCAANSRRTLSTTWRAAGVSRLMHLISRLTPAARQE